MKGYIHNFDWLNVEPMKYWSYTAATPVEKRQTEVKNAIFSGEYIGALKVDGYYQRILKDEDGNIFMIARSRNTQGEIVDKHEWVPQFNSFFEEIPSGTCFLAEVFIPNHEGSKNVTTILGCLKDKAIQRQQSPESRLHLYIFDVMAWNGENYNLTQYEDRVRKMIEIKNAYKDDPRFPCIHWATYYSGEDLWGAIQKYLVDGREGAVIMRRDAIVYYKRTPARVSIKIKQELKQTIDCIIIGANPPTKEYGGKEIKTWKYWSNELDGHCFLAKEPTTTNPGFIGELTTPEYCLYKRGGSIVPVSKLYYLQAAGSLRVGLVDEEGNVTEFCDVSGIEENILENWRDYIGKVCEIGGMMFSTDATGKISVRHPKFLGIREDKTPAECTWRQVK